jgi:hypothetical protein
MVTCLIRNEYFTTTSLQCYRYTKLLVTKKTRWSDTSVVGQMLVQFTRQTRVLLEKLFSTREIACTQPLHPTAPQKQSHNLQTYNILFLILCNSYTRYNLLFKLTLRHLCRNKDKELERIFTNKFKRMSTHFP